MGSRAKGSAGGHAVCIPAPRGLSSSWEEEGTSSVRSEASYHALSGGLVKGFSSWVGKYATTRANMRQHAQTSTTHQTTHPAAAAPPTGTQARPGGEGTESKPHVPLCVTIRVQEQHGAAAIALHHRSIPQLWVVCYGRRCVGREGVEGRGGDVISPTTPPHTTFFFQ